MKFWYFLPLLFFVDQSFAQFDMNKYLGSNTSSYELQVIKEQQQYLANNDFSSPFLREVEFRMRARDLESSPDDFRFRISPVNPWERKANDKYADALKEQLNTQWQVDYSQVLFRRYILLIQLYFYQQQLDVNSRNTAKYVQLIATYGQLENAGKEMLQIKKRIIFNDLKREEILGAIEVINYEVKLSYSFESIIQLPSLIVPSQIEAELAVSNEGTHNIFVQNEVNKSRLSEAEWQINKSESFSNLGFLQAEYRADDGAPLTETLGWQVGFQIPIFNNDRPDLQRRRLDVIEDQKQVDQKQQAVDLKTFSFENQLETVLQQHSQIEKALADVKNYEIADLSDIDVLLELDELTVELEEKKLEAYQRVLVNYIGWLEVTGNLVSQPLINHLDPTKPGIQLETE